MNGVWLGGRAQRRYIIRQLVLIVAEDRFNLCAGEQGLVVGACHTLLALLVRIETSLNRGTFVGQSPALLIFLLSRFAHSLRPLYRARLLIDVVHGHVLPPCLVSCSLVFVVEKSLECVITCLFRLSIILITTKV